MSKYNLSAALLSIPSRRLLLNPPCSQISCSDPELLFSQLSCSVQPASGLLFSQALTHSRQFSTRQVALEWLLLENGTNS